MADVNRDEIGRNIDPMADDTDKVIDDDTARGVAAGAAGAMAGGASMSSGMGAGLTGSMGAAVIGGMAARDLVNDEELASGTANTGSDRDSDSGTTRDNAYRDGPDPFAGEGGTGAGDDLSAERR